MKNLISILVLLTVSCAPRLSHLQTQSRQNVKMYQNLVESCVTVYDSTSIIGSGVIIDDTHIVTTGHVIDSTNYIYNDIYIKQRGRPKIEVSICKIDRDLDLAVLEVASMDHNTPLDLRCSVDVGEVVFTIGAPYGQTSVLSKGIVMKDDAEIIMETPYNGILISCIAGPGSSGSPVVDLDNKVVGIVEATLGRLVFVIPSSDIASIMSRI